MKILVDFLALITHVYHYGVLRSAARLLAPLALLGGLGGGVVARSTALLT